jgi:hypothetical protein
MSAKYTVDKIAAFVTGCTNEAVPLDRQPRFQRRSKSMRVEGRLA